MGSDRTELAAHRISLSASADDVPEGHPFMVTWQISHSGAAVCNSQFITACENGLETIEAVPDHGVRQMIHTHPGLITFTLAVAYDDGVKRRVQIRVRVSD